MGIHRAKRTRRHSRKRQRKHHSHASRSKPGVESLTHPCFEALEPRLLLSTYSADGVIRK